MSSPTHATERLVLSDGTIDPVSGRAARVCNAVSPLVLGLVVPLAVLVLVDPGTLRHGRFLLFAVMVPILLASVAIYVYSVFNPGDVSGIVADGSRRIVELHQANAFTCRRSEIPFAEVAAVQTARRYDRDGYAVERAELVLKSGEVVALSAAFGPAEVAALRHRLGLARVPPA
jgi:hypothetical protein